MLVVNYFVLFSSFYIFTKSERTKCAHVLSVDITNGTKLNDGSIMRDEIIFSPDLQFVYDDQIRGCVCNVRKCVRKCCESGMAVIDNKCKAYSGGFPLTIHDKHVPLEEEHDFYIIHNKKCSTGGFYKLEPLLYDEDVFYLQEDGSMFMPSDDKFLNQDEYCVDVFFDEEMNMSVSALVCFPKEDEEEGKIYYYHGMFFYSYNFDFFCLKKKGLGRKFNFITVKLV